MRCVLSKDVVPLCVGSRWCHLQNFVPEAAILQSVPRAVGPALFCTSRVLSHGRNGEPYQLWKGRSTSLAHHRRAMVLDRALVDAKFICDYFVGDTR